MKFSEYQTELNEAFDRPAQITKRDMQGSHFTLGDTQYLIEIYPTSAHGNQKALDVSFRSKKAGEHRYSYGLTGGDPKDAMTVFATVISEIKREVELHPEIAKVKFSAFEDSNRDDAAKRARLYKRMAEKFAKQLGYKLNVYGSGSGQAYVMEKTVELPEPTGYSKQWGQEELDLYEINDSAVCKVIGADTGQWSLANGAKLILARGKVTLTTGPIQSVDSWWDAFHELEWYNDEEGEQFYDDEQRICEVAGKIWVVGDMTITIWPNASTLERDAELELTSATRMALEF